MAVKSLIETVTVGAGGAASIEFLDIPQDGSDLVLALSLRGTNAMVHDNNYLTINGSITNINGRILYGTGSSAASGNWANYNLIGYINGASSTANTFGNSAIYFTNYTSSSNKSFSVDEAYENNATENRNEIIAGLINTTDAISALSIKPNGSGTYVQYSTASLYKIKYD